jgi:hypothetical protein
MNDTNERSCAARGSRWVAIVLAVMLAGCVEDAQTRPPREYTMKLTRPDGVLQSTYTLHSDVEPSVCESDAGCLRVYSRIGRTVNVTQPFPIGWLVEVVPKAEVE